MPNTRIAPQVAWNELMEGHLRFRAGKPAHPHQHADYRRSLEAGQDPNVALFGCADSRVPPDAIFDRGFGDIFIARNMGQILHRDITATMEFGVSALGVAVIIILSHSSCGAISAAITSCGPDPVTHSPAIQGELDDIVPAVRGVWGSDGVVDPGAIDADEVGRRHAVWTMEALIDSSELISSAIERGQLAIVACQYDLAASLVIPIEVRGDLDPHAIPVADVETL